MNGSPVSHSSIRNPEGRCRDINLIVAGVAFFAPDDLVTFVRDHFHDNRLLVWGAILPALHDGAGTREDLAGLTCGGCGQPLATPATGLGSHRTVCSERCEQRRFRHRKRERRLYVSLSDLPDLVPASPRRQSVRFGVRRQKAYRTRTKNGEPAKPLSQPEEQVIHLDEIAGTLHYHSVPIIVLTAPSQRLAGFPATDTSRDSRTKAIGHWTRAQAT
ncbi:MAG: hypothetical protein J2P48_03050 [Alphaproteobacteria bacterium]|nr:hypothetical protein [Alphaproteobacteria bacterium]